MILVKLGDYTRKVGIDASAEAIKEAIKSAFGLRTRRAFWLEDEDEVVRSLDRDMPLGTYTLHLDEGNEDIIFPQKNSHNSKTNFMHIISFCLENYPSLLGSMIFLEPLEISDQRKHKSTIQIYY